MGAGYLRTLLEYRGDQVFYIKYGDHALPKDRNVEQYLYLSQTLEII